MNLIVQKYGGTSVGNFDRINAVADHIASCTKRGQKTLVVVSAMGNHTNQLIADAVQLHPDPPRRELDLLLSAGERISMALVSIAIEARGIKTISFTGSQSGIITDQNHGNARIIRVTPFRIKEAFERVPVVIVAGFQGVSESTKDVTTLGRGGSDLTAVALAGALKAERCELYKDVDGIFSADPRKVSGARLIAELSWSTMSNLAWHGASVIHARAVDLALRNRIPLAINNSFNPEKTGTSIGDCRSMEGSQILAVTSQKGQVLLRMTFGNQTEQIERLAQFCDDEGITPVIQNIEVDRGQMILLVGDADCKKIQRNFSAPSHQTQSVGSVTVVGQSLRQNQSLLAKSLKALSPPPLFVDFQNDHLCFVTAENNLAPYEQALHTHLIG